MSELRFLKVVANERGNFSFDVSLGHPDLHTKGGKPTVFWRGTEWAKGASALLDDAAALWEKSGAPGAGPKSGRSGLWKDLMRQCADNPDSDRVWNQTLVYADTPARRDDYNTARLPYSPKEGPTDAWDILIDTLYEPSEREKIEWIMGAFFSNRLGEIQKMIAIDGPPGSGKSTLLDIFAAMVPGYVGYFSAKDLGDADAVFSTGVFADAHLLMIDHEADFSKLEVNERLNAIVSHDAVAVKRKHQDDKFMVFNSLILVATNNSININSVNSGILRRIIDVQPSGRLLPKDEYLALMAQVANEYGQIAHRCISVFEALGPEHYRDYRMTRMEERTNPIFVFVRDYTLELGNPEGITAPDMWGLYKAFAEEINVRPGTRLRFLEQIEPYFEKVETEHRHGRNQKVYYGLRDRSNKPKEVSVRDHIYTIDLSATESVLDRELAGCPAQYSSEAGTPKTRWSNVTTTLSDLDTTKEHYVRPPDNLIVIDFDIPSDSGGKDLVANLREAGKWPRTYTELSKSGAGVHLHYWWAGDVSRLATHIAPHIEIKVFTGLSALRRRASEFNGEPIAALTTQLPEKETPAVKRSDLENERHLRALIEKALKREIGESTATSVQFAVAKLEEAYKSGIEYDVEDLKPRLMALAMTSTNQAAESLKKIKAAPFQSAQKTEMEDAQGDIVLFDVEVFKNLFVVCWGYAESEEVVQLVNPPRAAIADLLKTRLVGFNNRRYDNHILMKWLEGATNEELYQFSKGLIDNTAKGIPSAFGISYTDIWDFSTNKEGLKKSGIDIGLYVVENEHPWDEPVPDDKVRQIVDYCVNDVKLTRALWHARKSDFLARQILAEVAGMPVNTPSNTLSAKIVFGDDKSGSQLRYTQLNTIFPGYKYEWGKSYLDDEEINEGGYVYSEPGYYTNVLVLDVASMHPSSIRELNLFGKYTKNYTDLMDIRLAIKRGNLDEARKMLDGRLAPYLDEGADLKTLSDALKLVINAAYGLTAASFDNPFRDKRNVDNIVAKRGALFMATLRRELLSRGVNTIHIKTDSIKLQNPSPEIVDFVMEFGRQYGYTFESEGYYDEFWLFDKAVNVGRKGESYSVTGAQYAHPVVYKTLFTGETPVLEDYYETKKVAGEAAIYFQDPTTGGRVFAGRVARVAAATNGYEVLRCVGEKEGAVSGTKGYLWSPTASLTEIDYRYYDELVEKARLKMEVLQ